MWEAPVFKILAPNDTSERPGHQGGIVIPKDIEDYFPDVTDTTSQTHPTVDVEITADLIIGNIFVTQVKTRYQYQTWGGTRNPERRLTSNLGPIRDAASGGDIVLFSRDADNSQRMLITLLKAGSAEHSAIVAANPNRRWGISFGSLQPTKNSEVRAEAREIRALLEKEFNLFDHNRRSVETTAKRKARNRAFREILLQAYGPVCQVSAESINADHNRCNLDAAHIVPVEVGGSDDPRNGLVLSKDFHWAFDNGLFTIGDDFEIAVRNDLLIQDANLPLHRIHNRKLAVRSGGMRPDISAIRWHRENKLRNV